MSEQTFDELDDPQDDDQQQPQQQSGQRQSSAFRDNQRKLEKRARERDEAVARADAAERRLAFLEAGVDTSNPMSQWFIKGYDGDLAPDKVRKAAEEAGLIAQPVAQQAQPPQQPFAQPPPYAPQQPYAGIGTAFGQIDAATAAPPVPGVNHLANMQKALESGGIEGMAQYMRAVGLPVADDNR